MTSRQTDSEVSARGPLFGKKATLKVVRKAWIDGRAILRRELGVECQKTTWQKALLYARFWKLRSNTFLIGFLTLTCIRKLLRAQNYVLYPPTVLARIVKQIIYKIVIVLYSQFRFHIILYYYVIVLKSMLIEKGWVVEVGYHYW